MTGDDGGLLMVSPFASRLFTARHERFVGRSSERDLFKSTVSGEGQTNQIIYIFGPGGIGKTSLLLEFAFICHELKIPAAYIDGRNVEPVPESLLRALHTAFGLSVDDSLLGYIASQERCVLLLDTYEMLAPLDNWLLNVFLAQLPDSAVLVLAGRQPPSLAWRSDPGLQVLAQTLPLRNLSPDESRAFLTIRGIPEHQHQPVLQFAHGHPLALSLVADTFAQRPQMRFQPEAAPDVVKMLLEQLVQKVPSPAHRAALEATAIVQAMTESLLASMLALPDAHEIFEWLRGLSFVESGGHGLFLHDLAREALVADLRWRNPDWYAELHERARVYYTRRLQQTTGLEQQLVLFQYIFLHRDNPVVRPFFEWQESGGALTDMMKAADVPELVAMVARHEGEGSAALAEYWLKRHPQGALVFRDSESTPAGFLAMVPLHSVSDADLEVDPAVRASCRYLQTHAPLRPGESATLFRFWMARDSYQAVSAVQSVIFVNVVRHYLTTPGLAFTFFPCSEPDFWAAVFAYADLNRLSEADFAVGGKSYGMYGHDWRVVPPITWLELLAQREVATEVQVVTPPELPQQLLVLSQPDFVEAVRGALRNLTRPAALGNSPLLRSRLVVERAGRDAGKGERIAVLQAAIREAAELLKQSPREERFYRALQHAYISPAATQERAAELLDLPFSTFRRYLQTAIVRVTRTLWEWETGEWGK